MARDGKARQARLGSARQGKARQYNRFGAYCASGGSVIIGCSFSVHIGVFDKFHSGFVDASGFGHEHH